MNAHHHELYSHAIGAHGAVAAYGHYGRPVLAFPSEGGKAYDWQDNGMIGAARRTCSRPAGSSSTASTPSTPPSWSNQSIPLEERAREHGRYESWILDDVVPFIHHDTGGEIITTGDQPRRLPRRELRAQARRPVPARDLHVGQLRPGDLERLGRARRRDVLQQPARLRRAVRRRPPRVAALAAQPAAGLRPGPVGGHHGLARVHQAPRRACSPRRASATSSTCGATTSRTTGRPGAPRSPTISRGSADVFETHT